MAKEYIKSEQVAEGLKPCPFCGSKNIRLSNWGMYRCWCADCLAKTDDTIYAKDAKKAWNRRVQQWLKSTSGEKKKCG